MKNEEVKENESVVSKTSSFTSHSGEDAAEIHRNIIIELGNKAGSIKELSLENLVGRAKEIIEEFKSNPSNTYKYTKNSKQVSVQLNRVMEAMLACVEECGGKDGKRYVASAICLCSEGKNRIELLANLGTTWLTHLLFIFQTTRSHKRQSNTKPSKIAAPTSGITMTYLLKGIGTRRESFRHDVMARDGYTCVVTGTKDYSHPKLTTGTHRTFLECAHIVRRAIGNFSDMSLDSKSYMSALTTFDILRNFACLPLETLEALDKNLDDPSNGMMLQKDAHDAFDHFYWCLKPTNVKHKYTLRVFKEGGIQHIPDYMSFSDRRNDFSPKDLPDPLYIAIHAAIAEILSMSGAGEFFDELFEEYKDEDGDVPEEAWLELEELMWGSPIN